MHKRKCYTTIWNWYHFFFYIEVSLHSIYHHIAPDMYNLNIGFSFIHIFCSLLFFIPIRIVRQHALFMFSFSIAIWYDVGLDAFCHIENFACSPGFPSLYNIHTRRQTANQMRATFHIKLNFPCSQLFKYELNVSSRKRFFFIYANWNKYLSNP